MNQTNINIAQIIKKGRMKKGISQKELAKLMNITPSLISKWEQGQTTPRGDYLIKLANILEIVNDFFPDYQGGLSPHVTEAKFKNEIDKIWQAIRQKDQEEADFRKITLCLLKEKFSSNDTKINKNELVSN